jgi:hypothetical protein
MITLAMAGMAVPTDQNRMAEDCGLAFRTPVIVDLSF